MTDLVGHFLLFAVLIVVLLMVTLIAGRFVRPKLPNPEKDAIYECGEPTIGSSYIQFDLRFYVVALLFIIFDVEVAFFFPWALVYGGAMQLADSRISADAQAELSAKMLNTPVSEMTNAHIINPEVATSLGVIALVDILVFFGVLLVGFAYIWKRGDLDWVRAVAKKTQQAEARPKQPPVAEVHQESTPVGT